MKFLSLEQAPPLWFINCNNIIYKLIELLVFQTKKKQSGCVKKKMIKKNQNCRSKQQDDGKKIYYHITMNYTACTAVDYITHLTNIYKYI
jgi:hypothetical protein